MSHAQRFRALLPCALLATACARERAPDIRAPNAEFLISAGDSTYWVRSNAEGMLVRSAPILLTRVDGRFYEVFVESDNTEYDDASFTSSRVWSRELPKSDSVLLFEDTTVRRQAAAWKKRHPREEILPDDDDRLSDDPRTVVASDVEIVEVHGPYLSFRHMLDVDVDVGEPHRHQGRRAVVDVRTGRRVTMDALFGATETARITSVARSSLSRLLDSVRTARDERAVEARETLGSFRFGATSFALTDSARTPAVEFLVPGTSREGEALAIYLPPITTTEPTWWRDVRATLPEWATDSSRVRWSLDAYEVLARPVTADESLSLRLARHGLGTTMEWPVATVSSPVFELIALDAPPVSDATRDALARAFDMSTSLSGVMQRAVWTGTRARARPRTRLRRMRDTPH